MQLDLNESRLTIPPEGRFGAHFILQMGSLRHREEVICPPRLHMKARATPDSDLVTSHLCFFLKPFFKVNLAQWHQGGPGRFFRPNVNIA